MHDACLVPDSEAASAGTRAARPPPLCLRPPVQSRPPVWEAKGQCAMSAVLVPCRTDSLEASVVLPALAHRGPCGRAPSAGRRQHRAALAGSSPARLQRSQASAARLNGAVRASGPCTSKARPLRYARLSLSLLPLPLPLLPPPSVLPSSSTLCCCSPCDPLPPAAACLDWPCLCSPANILRGW